MVCISQTSFSKALNLANRSSLFAVACAFLLLGGVALADGPSGCAPQPQQEALDTTPPINIGLLAERLVYYRCSDYDKDVQNTLAQARAWIEQRAPQVVKPAVVLDIDETSLSNWEQIYHNKFAYVPTGSCDLASSSACGQREWELSARATAIRSTLDLFNAAKQLKDKGGGEVAIFFVTGRYEEPFGRIATDWNLRKVGYEGWRALIMRPEPTRDQKVSDFKTKARQDIEKDGYTIIANIGDQLSDLVGEHAEKCFKVANPFYFIRGTPIPETGLKCLSR